MANRRQSDKPKCALCGKSKKLTRTACCGNLICDDEDKYVAFSYARNSCHRNHDRYTLCAYHHHEDHAGHWKDCQECRRSFKTELYVWYGTNEYNFERLENPPAITPTHCVDCGAVIRLAIDGHEQSEEGYRCDACATRRMAEEPISQAFVPGGDAGPLSLTPPGSHTVSVDRGALIVRPRQPYLDWAAGLDDSDLVPDAAGSRTVGPSLCAFASADRP